LVLAAAIIFFGNSQRVIAQWSTASGTNNIYYNAGNVGIGTSTPNKSAVSKALTVNGSTDAIYELAVGDVRKGNIYHTGTNMSIFNNANGPLLFGTNNAERKRCRMGAPLRTTSSRHCCSSRHNQIEPSHHIYRGL